MVVFEILVLMLLFGAVTALFARRIGAPYPSMVALAGAALAMIPGMPSVHLDPELTLTLLIAPVLVDTAFEASPRDLRQHWRPIVGLALGAVTLTTALVAGTVRLLVPEMSWAVAITLGAIVAPPDAAAAAAVLKQLKLPQRLLVILEGESLFNDASALLLYRLAVGYVTTGLFSTGHLLPTLVWFLAGSVVLGLVVAWFMNHVISRIDDVPTSAIVQFCGTFTIWVIAERLHLSGIITLVVFAMAAARRGPELMPARIRVPTFAVWEVVVFVLNVLAFTLVGFQLQDLSDRISPELAARYAVVAVAVLAAVILARFLWVAGVIVLRRRLGDAASADGRTAAVVGWCGMRGMVTLAVALALPDGGAAPFPHRDLILVCSFAVVLGTLVLQGFTLRPLLCWLALEADDTHERELKHARVEILRPAVLAVREASPVPLTHLVQHSLNLQLAHAERALNPLGGDVDGSAVRLALEIQRHHLLQLRNDGIIGEGAFQQLELELDQLELGWAQMGMSADRPT